MTNFKDRFDMTVSLLCIHDHNTEAVGVFLTPDGCLCFNEKLQPLCAQHAFKAQQNSVNISAVHWFGEEEPKDV